MNKKQKMILGGIVTIIIIVAVIIFLKMTNTSYILFNDEYQEIEYGSKVTYKDFIKELDDKDAKVAYPKTEIKEVGTYNVIFKYKVDGKETKEVDYTFKVVDTKVPSISLQIEDKKVEVAINTDYQILNNIKAITDLSDEGMANKVLLSKQDYKKTIEQVNDAKKEIDKRIVTEKYKELEVIKNAVIYTTDFDITKEGNYTVKAIAIDENYNVSNEMKWSVKVVPGGKILNSGGSVSCDYTGDDVSKNEAYTTAIKENYVYNPLKIIERYELITTMSFNEDYNTESNINTLKTALSEKYSHYTENKGISFVIDNNASQVITKISVNFMEYDLKNDPLNILVKKDGSYVKIQSILDDAETNKFVCTIH